MTIRIAKVMAYAVETYTPGKVIIAKAMAYATEGTTPRPVAPFVRKRREARQFFP